MVCTKRGDSTAPTDANGKCDSRTHFSLTNTLLQYRVSTSLSLASVNVTQEGEIEATAVVL